MMDFRLNSGKAPDRSKACPNGEGDALIADGIGNVSDNASIPLGPRR